MKTWMMMAALVAAMTLVATPALAGTELAARNVGPNDHVVWIPFVGTFYVICGPPAEVWQETNGVPGLQKHPWTDRNGVHPADTPLLIFENDLAGYLISLYCHLA